MGKRKPKAPIVVTHQTLGPPIEEDFIGGVGITQSGSFGPAAEMAAKARERTVELPELRMPPGHDTAPAAFATEEPPFRDGKRGDGGLVWEAPPLWADRLRKLATHAGVTPGHYLEMLVRKQWAAGAAVVTREKP